MPHHEYSATPPFKPNLEYIPKGIRLTEEEFEELNRFKAAVLWHYNQRGHDRCHENIKEMYKRCGLPPLDEADLPPRSEFRQMCQKYEEKLYNGGCDDGY